MTTAATPSNQNVEAYNALLQGNFYDNRVTAEDTRKAIGYYEEAIRLDPRYALAYAKLSVAAGNLANAFGSLSMKEREEANAKARASAKKALALDPNLAEAHRAQGWSMSDIDFNFAGRGSGIATRPRARATGRGDHFESRHSGVHTRAARRSGRAPGSGRLRSSRYAAGSHYNLSLNLTALGRYDEAEAAKRKAIELQPQAAQNYLQLARIQILRGNSGAAVEFAKKETDPFWRTYALALAHFANGDRAEADAALKKLIDEDADTGASQIAQVYALRKEPDKMFEWLEHGWPTKDPGVTELLIDPFLRAYKDDPRFIAFAQKIGVMPKAGRQAVIADDNLRLEIGPCPVHRHRRVTQSS